MNPKPNTKGLVRFKKGNSGGPGRPRLPEELRGVKALTATEFKAILWKWLATSQEETRKALASKELDLKHAIVCKFLLMARRYGDAQRFNLILDRLIGKVVEKADITITEPLVIKRLNGSEVVITTMDEMRDEKEIVQ